MQDRSREEKAMFLTFIGIYCNNFIVNPHIACIRVWLDVGKILWPELGGETTLSAPSYMWTNKINN